MSVGVCVLLPLGLLRWLRQHPSWRGRCIEKWKHQVLLLLALWVQEEVGGQDLGIRQGVGVHMLQAHWLGVQGQDQALGRRQPEVQRTLGHQGPNLGLGVNVEPCPGSRLGCWVGLQILIQEEGPRQSPRPITQDRKTQLRASWMSDLECDAGNKGPFSSKQA